MHKTVIYNRTDDIFDKVVCEAVALFRPVCGVLIFANAVNIRVDSGNVIVIYLKRAQAEIMLI